MKTHASRSQKMKGFTLPELIVAIIVIAVSAMGVWAWYANNTINNEVKTTQSIVDKIVQNAPAIKKTYGTYENIDTLYIWGSSRYLDATYKNPTAGQIMTPYSTDGITVEPMNSATMVNGRVLSGTNMFLGTTMNDVNANACQDLAEYYFKTAVELRVGTTRVADPTAINTECNGATDTIDITVIVN